MTAFDYHFPNLKIPETLVPVQRKRRLKLIETNIFLLITFNIMTAKSH